MASGQISYKEPDRLSPCVRACPAGVDVPLYVRCVSQGKYDEALSVIRDRIPFPSVCGYVCNHPCENACHAGRKLGKPIAIRALKRFAAEHGTWQAPPRTGSPTGKKVAIVGSGPAGLSAGYYLARLGHGVTVFESMPKAGGMLRYGIPEYRLPRDVLDNEIEYITDAGVEVQTGREIGSLDELLSSGSDAVFLALGAHEPVDLDIEADSRANVIDCTALLEDVNSGQEMKLGESVAVIGGDHAAIDSARSAIRLGAKDVTVFHRRPGIRCRPRPEDVQEALQEGVKIDSSTTPKKIVNKGSLALLLARVKPETADAGGNDSPETAGGEFFASFANVIVAAGQTVSLPPGFDVARGEDGAIKVDPVTLKTSRDGVFAGGDAVTGPASVIEAIAAGRKAAGSIDEYLGGSGDLGEGLTIQDDTTPAYPAGMPLGDRNEGHLLPVDERTGSFATVELGFASEEEAVNEAKRCLRCDLPIAIDGSKCTGCLTCSMYCSLVNQHLINPMNAYVDADPFREEEPIIFAKQCDHCGICARYCPYGALSR